MKGMFLAAAVVAGCAMVGLAQQKSQSSFYTFDVNGHPVNGRSISETSSPGRRTRTERIRSINGRDVPVESVEEKVLRQGPNGRVIERIIHRYDQNGRPTPPEKVRIEETIRGGRKIVQRTVSRADINGNYSVTERSVEESVQRGDVIHTSISIERPTVNGDMGVVEKRAVVTTKQKNGSQTDLTIYRKGENGDFQPAAREVKAIVTQGNRQRVTSTRYNTANASGRMAFAGETVSDIQQHPDGTQTTVIRIYGAAAPGRSESSGSRKPQLREEDIIEQQKGPGHTVVEKTLVRRVTLADANRLGPARLVSETVCTGHCLSKPAAAGARKKTGQKK